MSATPNINPKKIDGSELPTSNSGLSAGDLWAENGFVKNATATSLGSGTKVLVTGSFAGSGTVQTFAVGHTKIEFDDSVTGGTDVNSEWDNTNHRFTVGASGAGVYIFQASLFVESSSGWGSVYLKKGGSQLVTQNLGVSGHNDSHDDIDGSVAVELAVGEYVEFWAHWRTGTGNIKDSWGMEIHTFSITKVGDSTTVNNIVAQTLNKTITLEEPVNGDDITIFRTDVAITVKEVISVLVGSGTTVTHQLYHHPTRNSASANALTTSQNINTQLTGNASTLSTAAIPADSWVWVEFTAPATATAGQYITIDIRYEE
tara:strand:+ start:1687 stop:2634 length:948 start_codon:yes stop_codon:yes gene_type:complete